MFDLIAELLMGLLPEVFAESVFGRVFFEPLSKIQNNVLRTVAGMLVLILCVLTGVMVAIGLLFLMGFVVLKLGSLLQ